MSEEKILGKFDGQEDLIKAYQELEKKLSEKPKSEPQIDIQAEVSKAIKAHEAAKQHARQSEISKFLESKEVQSNISRALGGRVAGVNKRLEDDQITIEELKKLSEEGRLPEESGDGVDSKNEDSELKGLNEEQILSKYDQFLGSYAEALDDPKHASHGMAVKKEKEFKKFLGI